MDILRILQNSVEVADMFSTDWESDFGKTFAVGSSVQVKLPQRFLVTDGLGYQPQGFNRLSTTVNLDQIFGIHFEWDSYERMVRMERSEEELREQYTETRCCPTEAGDGFARRAVRLPELLERVWSTRHGLDHHHPVRAG
jgi:hypothetical protein